MTMDPHNFNFDGVPDHQIHHPPFSTGSASGGASGVPTPLPSPVVKRRAAIACRRCRRMRSKCVHDNAQPPCKACEEAGLGPGDCSFPRRGQPDNDRQYRHPRVRAAKATARHNTARVRRSTLDSRLDPVSALPEDEWHGLPPLSEIIDAVHRFLRRYFQLGFIPKQQYIERLRRNYRSVNVFLLLGILSISARLSPALSKRYGSGIRAAEFFIERAAAMAVGEIYGEPTLERCQAFYLLSIAQQGNGIRNQSHINMGISMRLATLMQLHREETYRIQNPTPSLIIRAESARRTLWMLHSQDSLHHGPKSPVSLAASDITALLPCDEADFAAGRLPQSRPALADTPPAIEEPSLTCDPNRSLFASLMQIHHFWGIVGRRAADYCRSSYPWDPGSESSQVIKKLREWEASLPQEHTWSTCLLQKHKAEGHDLAYLGVTMMSRICNIVARRPYLGDIINMDQRDAHHRPLLSNLSNELFTNVHNLFKQINAQYSSRSPDESVGTQMAAFCVYSCGHHAAYLCKYPNICPDRAVAEAGPHMLSRTRSILAECEEVWPLASHWLEALESLDKFFRDPQATAPTTEGSMADGKDPVPHVLNRPSPPFLAPQLQRQLTPELSSSSFSSSTFSQPTPYPPHQQQLPHPQQSEPFAQAPHPPPAQQQEQQQQQQQQPESFPQAGPPQPPHNAFPVQHEPNLVHGQQQQPHGGVYFSRDDQPVNDLGMLVQTFDQPSAGNAPPQPVTAPYDMNAAAVASASAAMPYYPQPMGPRNDGFKDELQLYLGESNEWIQAGGWMNGY